MSGQIPVEFVGRARDLRRRVEKEWRCFDPGAENLLAPFRKWPGFRPVPTKSMLNRLAHNWKRLPNFGRLRLHTRFESGHLQIAEVRCMPAKIVANGWDSDEPALGLMVASISIKPPDDLHEAYIVPAIVGLHALSRRFERSFARDDKAVFDDLVTIVRHAQRDDRGFNVKVLNGTWVGSRAADGVFCVRTYFEN